MALALLSSPGYPGIVTRSLRWHPCRSIAETFLPTSCSHFRSSPLPLPFLQTLNFELEPATSRDRILEEAFEDATTHEKSRPFGFIYFLGSFCRCVFRTANRRDR